LRVLNKRKKKNTIPAELQQGLYAYLIGTARNLGITMIAVGGTTNHAHLLMGLKPTAPIAEAVQKLKANSSRRLSEHGAHFEWQKGYAAFSVSPSMVETVKRYIRTQEEHHRKWSFEQELISLLRKSGVSYDERYLFRRDAKECRPSRDSPYFFPLPSTCVLG
jgi:putative transposase